MIAYMILILNNFITIFDENFAKNQCDGIVACNLILIDLFFNFIKRHRQTGSEYIDQKPLSNKNNWVYRLLVY